MKKISTVIITKNEAANIARCIRSVLKFSDEIIVVDDYSNDQTKAICKEYNVIFVSHKFIDFAHQKNKALSRASFPFIFSIDADEEVSSDLNKSILKAKVSGKSDFYTLNRCTNYLGKWIRYSGWYPDKKIRLWRKDKAKWVGVVHEVLTPKPKNAVQLSGDLLHHSYPSLRWHIEKINHYTDIAAKQMFENGKHVSSFKIILSMNFEFFKKFLIQLGFLDGYHGFLLALMSAYYTLVKYAKLRNLHLKFKQSV